jgi:hypothetical protein
VVGWWFVAAAGAACPVEGEAIGVSADGAAHVLARGPAFACWWIVDDVGDARLGGRWDRSRRDPLLAAGTADGRVAAVLRDDEGVRLSVRAEGGGDRRLAVLGGVPESLVAHPASAVVALVRGEVAWLYELDTGGRSEGPLGEAPAWVRAPAAAVSAEAPDAPR